MALADVLGIACDELKERRISELQPFSASEDDAGNRTYSNLLDGRALEAYTHNLIHDARLLCVDIYCDVVPLPSSGAQSVSPVRVRYPNLYGVQTK